MTDTLAPASKRVIQWDVETLDLCLDALSYYSQCARQLQILLPPGERTLLDRIIDDIDALADGAQLTFRQS
jgi:hypothetical protein